MTRKEYLESLQTTPIPASNTIAQELTISDRKYYMQVRRALMDFEDQPIELTEEDFRAFDRNFLACIEDLQYTDKDSHEVSDVDQAISMMRATDWQWATASVKPHGMHIPNNVEFITTVNELYEHMLENPKPRMSISSAGFSLELDIVDHTVRMIWGHIDYEHFDDEFATE